MQMQTIQIRDQLHVRSWCQGSDAYSSWCRANCCGDWNIYKYSPQIVFCDFEDPRDITLFLLVFGPAL